jgi:hypothetical protein
VLAAPRPSPLRALAGVPGVLGFFDRPEMGEAELTGALASFSGPILTAMNQAVTRLYVQDEYNQAA